MGRIVPARGRRGTGRPGPRHARAPRRVHRGRMAAYGARRGPGSSWTCSSGAVKGCRSRQPPSATPRIGRPSATSTWVTALPRRRYAPRWRAAPPPHRPPTARQGRRRSSDHPRSGRVRVMQDGIADRIEEGSGYAAASARPDHQECGAGRLQGEGHGRVLEHAGRPDGDTRDPGSATARSAASRCRSTASVAVQSSLRASKSNGGLGIQACISGDPGAALARCGEREAGRVRCQESPAGPAPWLGVTAPCSHRLCPRLE